MELQTILGSDKGRAAFYKARDNFTALQTFLNSLSAATLQHKGYLHNYLPSGGNLNILENGIYDVTTWADFIDYPPNAYQYGQLTVNNSTQNGLNVQYYIPNATGKIYYKQGWNADHGSWIEILTSKASDWIIGTLQNGWTGTFKYRKNNIGQIEAQFNIVAGTVAAYTVVAQFPDEYITSYTTPPALVEVETGKIVDLYMSADGSIRIPVGETLVTGNHYNGTLFYTK